MPRPDRNPELLFDPNPRLPEYDFTADEMVFHRLVGGTRGQMCLLKCFQEAALSAGVRPQEILEEPIRLAAARNVPAEWKTFCNIAGAPPPYDPFSALGYKLVERALSGKAVSIPKAMLMILALEEVVSRAGQQSNLDIYDVVRIAPLVFRVGGFDLTTHDRYLRKHKLHQGQAVVHAGQNSHNVHLLKEWASGRGSSYAASNGLRTYLVSINRKEIGQVHLPPGHTLRRPAADEKCPCRVS
jgi:hypothetical protein